MKTLYLDIFSGISGDMFLGAMVNLGVDGTALEKELKKLKLNGYHLHIRERSTGSIRGIKFDVHLENDHGHEHHHHAAHEHDSSHAHEHDHSHHHSHQATHSASHEHTHSLPEDHDHERSFTDIKKLINGSKLSNWVKEKSIAIFLRIAEAEGKVHGVKPEKVHFHEVGAVDSIVDIVGACIALELMGNPRVIAAPVVEGSGWIDCAHGRFPVPAAATLEILGAKGIAITQCDETTELVTPTGAAILAEFCEEFKPMENLVAEKIGYGLGSRQLKSRPNCLRAVLGASGCKPASTPKAVSSGTDSTSAFDWETDEVYELQTNLDDINGEVLGAFIQKALTKGALDAFYTPIQMKKNRPAILLTVLCPKEKKDVLVELILRETTSFGVRFHAVTRHKLQREWTTVTTRHGDISVKIGLLNSEAIQASPEFESCQKIAKLVNVPLKEVYTAAIKALKPGKVSRKIKR